MKRYIVAIALGFLVGGALKYATSQGIGPDHLAQPFSKENEEQLGQSKTLKPIKISKGSHGFAKLSDDELLQTDNIEMLTQAIKKIDLSALTKLERYQILESYLSHPINVRQSFFEVAVAAKNIQLAERLIISVASEDPDSGLALLDHLALIDNLDTEQKHAIERSFVTGFMQKSPQKSWEWVQSRPTSGQKDNRNSEWMRSIVAMHVINDGTQQEWLLDKLRSSNDFFKYRLERRLAVANVERGPLEAVEIAYANYQQNSDKVLLNHTLAEWIVRDAKAATDYIFERPNLLDETSLYRISREITYTQDLALFERLVDSVEDKSLLENIRKDTEFKRGGKVFSPSKMLEQVEKRKESSKPALEKEA